MTSAAISVPITIVPKIRVRPWLPSTSSAMNQATINSGSSALGLLTEDQEGEVPQVRLADRIGNALEHEDATEGASGRCSVPRDPARQPEVERGHGEEEHASADPEVDDRFGTTTGRERDADRHRHGEENDDGGHEASDRSHDVHHLLESRNVNGIGTLRLSQRWRAKGVTGWGPARNSRPGQPSFGSVPAINRLRTRAGSAADAAGSNRPALRVPCAPMPRAGVVVPGTRPRRRRWG